MEDFLNALQDLRHKSPLSMISVVNNNFGLF